MKSSSAEKNFFDFPGAVGGSIGEAPLAVGVGEIMVDVAMGVGEVMVDVAVSVPETVVAVTVVVVAATVMVVAVGETAIGDAAAAEVVAAFDGYPAAAAASPAVLVDRLSGVEAAVGTANELFSPSDLFLFSFGSYEFEDEEIRRLSFGFFA